MPEYNLMTQERELFFELLLNACYFQLVLSSYNW